MELRGLRFTGEDVVNKPSRKRAVDARTPQKPPPPAVASPACATVPPRQFVSRTAVLLHGFAAAEARELGDLLIAMGAIICDDEAAVLRAAQADAIRPSASDQRHALVVACEAGADAELLRRFTDAPVAIVNAAWVHDAFHQATTPCHAELPEAAHHSLVRDGVAPCYACQLGAFTSA
jgi:hypothetical protein